MLPEVHRLWNQMRADREAFRAAVEAVLEELLDWRPPCLHDGTKLKRPPTVREIALHAIGADQVYCQRILQGNSEVQRISIDTPCTKDELLRMIDEDDRRCEAVLEQIAPELWTEVRAETWGSDPHGPHTTEFFVRQINRHRYYHAAQINYIHLMLGIE